jgi:hypothetical protein
MEFIQHYLLRIERWEVISINCVHLLVPPNKFDVVVDREASFD